MAVVEDEDKYHSQDQIFTTPISSMTNDYTRDLINKFMAVEAAKTENQRRQRCNLPMPTLMPMPTVRHVQQQQLRFDTEKMSVADESYELSLGLSSNGRFGIDPNAKKIKRAVSISESSMIPMIPAAANGSGDDAENLIRTCSLPVVKPAENREEWLRRKEVQSQRRLEARRRKDEKRRQSRASRERSSSSRERGAGSEAGGENSNNNPVEQGGAPADGLIRTTSLVRRVGGIILTKEIDQVVPISPPTSGGSNGGSSSGNSVSDVLPRQGTTPMNIGNPNSSNIAGPQNKTKVVSFLEGSSLSKNANIFEGASSGRPQNIIMTASNRPQNITMTASNPLDEMPSVTTKGGPNGRRIEGFLYKYGRGRRNVKIVCVCHGSFLTPAEFVRHAGGGDVTNPLQHIVVNRR